MKHRVWKMLSLLLVVCMSLSFMACQKQEGGSEAIPAEDAGMSMDDGEQFKPSDYTLPVKDQYVYDYLGLEFTLPEAFKQGMADKQVAMLDDQSPIDQELTYAMLTFDRMTEEQRNAMVDKMGDGYEAWQKGLDRLGTIGMFAKELSEAELTQITGCDTHSKIGSSADGLYDYYLSTNEGTQDELLEAFKQTEVNVIEKQARPEHGFVLAERSDLEGTEMFGNETATDLSGIVTKDIDGNAFSSQDFADYDLTMVNVFATWCTACVKEIPDLVQVEEAMKDKGVRIIGVVTDTVDDHGENQEAIEKAKVIQEKTKANYPFLMPDETNFNGRLDGIQALPETFFVDKNGQIVGEPYSGAKSAEEWQQIIEKELANVK